MSTLQERKTGTRTAVMPVSVPLKTKSNQIHVRSVMSRLAELSTHLQSQLNDAD
jgi:hypothetical protein